MNVYILYILILQHFLNNRHDMYALFHLKQTNKLLYQLSLNINVKINDILKKYFSRSNICCAWKSNLCEFKIDMREI